jgi:glycosyltransferase involved in cell wall biosynthesis
LSASLTACLIVRDEEERLPDCLASLGFCDEVVVVDSGSTDRTCELAREAGARVLASPWRGFAVQRNVALDAAGGEWVIEVDADERVSEELAAEIRRFLEAPPPRVRMAALPLRDVFLGTPLGPSSRYPRYRHRLFRRGCFRHDEARTVHEGLWPDGEVAVMAGELRHLLAAGWREAVADALAYARLEAAQRPAPGPGETLVGLLVRPLAKLCYRLFLYGGWRDGMRGLLRISLECGGDSLATLLRLRNGAAGEGAAGFGQEPPRLGPVRLLGVALSPGGDARLGPWLAAAGAAGADVALISPLGEGSDGVRRRVLDGRGPGALVRALDAEDQARPVDALVPAGARERALARLAPAALRGAIPPLPPSLQPAAAAGEAMAACRPPGSPT